MYSPSLPRLEPIAMRRPISLRRRSVRNQNVPTIPKNTFTSRKAIMESFLLFSFLVNRSWSSRWSARRVTPWTKVLFTVIRSAVFSKKAYISSSVIGHFVRTDSSALLTPKFFTNSCNDSPFNIVKAQFSGRSKSLLRKVGRTAAIVKGSERSSFSEICRPMADCPRRRNPPPPPL